ncbi:ACP S-malonyltransferase [Kitasatospora sp. NPDC058965]|uniref:ACP S-malonyltransferase n=1 Tax=Kitasatospora sp. NPDC058965 TaxID=3346682 RepID=UPI00369163B5
MATEQRAGEATAIVFPGMGPCPFSEVAKFMLINPAARRLVGIADEVLGYDLVERFRTSEGDYSEAAQVAFMVNCLALAEWAEEAHGMRTDYVVGPSFGEKAAAVWSGALSFPQAVRMTADWAVALEEYFAREHTEIVVQSFARVPREQLDLLLGELTAQGEWYDIACHVDHDFYMICVREGLLDSLQQRIRSLGGLPLYMMRPPMHSAAFAPLRERMAAEVFAGLHFTDPRIPVVADQDGTVLTSADGVRTMLLDGFTRAVNWPKAVAELRRLGVGTVYVSGPDSLFGRVGVTTRSFKVVPLNPRAALRPGRRPATVFA